MPRYWILDQDETPQGFPLQRLLRAVREVAAPAADRCELARVRGYGEQVGEWDSASDAADAVVVSMMDLDRIAEGTVEWFYDVEVRFLGSSVRCGLHDSSAMFLDAEAALAKPILEQFARVRADPA